MATKQATETRKSLASIMAALNKVHGEGTVVLASSVRMKPVRLSTGSLALDVSMGGGWPVNQWAELIGNEGMGKTTLTLKTVAHAQANDENFIVAWVAAESYDEDYAALLGVDNSRVILIEENVMEHAYEAALALIGNRAVDMVVIDSLPALVPLDENDKAMDEWSPGAGARRTNQFMRKATKATKRSLIAEDRPIVGIIINQWREKIGVQHGDPRTTPGGKAKNFWMYARMESRRDEWLLDPKTKERVGLAIKISTIKMKGARPGPPVVVDFYFHDTSDGHKAGQYDSAKEALILGIYYNIVERRGSTYIFDDVRYRGGKAAFFEAVAGDEELMAKLRARVMDAYNSGDWSVEPPAEDDE